MNAIIVSDIHLGNRYCAVERFVALLDGVGQGTELILNGDVVDFWHRTLEDEHRQALRRLRDLSLRTRVVWVYGNHDDGYALEDRGNIEFVRSYALGSRLHISHGYDFDNVMPYNRCFIHLFRLLHAVRLRLGAEPVHVAHYAKRWLRLYNVLRRHVRLNAVEYARENGFESITCGHTHYAEDLVVDGIRYINTGAWTERPLYALRVNDTSMELAREP